jgi:hypothetical protein
MQIINNYNIVYDVFYKNEKRNVLRLIICHLRNVLNAVCVLCITCNDEENFFFSPPPNCRRCYAHFLTV